MFLLQFKQTLVGLLPLLSPFIQVDEIFTKTVNVFMFLLQLKQTLVDLLLMFPILPTLIIPCMEVLIPVFMYIGMIPKVFISKEARV
jgi:hypothetical protein